MPKLSVAGPAVQFNAVLLQCGAAFVRQFIDAGRIARVPTLLLLVGPGEIAAL